ncbi:alpha/beta-hydrolase [Sistotremastrum suecicum HHB10207 ss-3]|uniref:Alpha/beta-hydrolase n=1 Tax=Sistotremastrum suecicum HHB10207 ss-3 TaxID=1314776 RepID=A0A166DC15_9AGAM|nr:alpha/beta-hydrolase [Sistotremastrum suecicum HHB10207 ss-3]
MTIHTATVVARTTPVVIGTFLKHYRRKLKDSKEKRVNDPTDDILFDQAFHIVKSFIDYGTHDDVESLQAFTNTHIPSPPWAFTESVMIPLAKCNEAADLLIQWFGPQELQSIVGGEKWWQVRGLDGIEAEWLTMRSLLHSTRPGVSNNGETERKPPSMTRGLNSLERVMLYIHGGAFYWGSINTHRYQILRFARKIKGRCFAVNYRKAPQYPWPCPLQDCLAAYLFLIRPPPGVLHTAIDPGKIVLAGDSAGGGLCVALLTLIRDLGLPMPAGATLISPWVDLTHSFPSVMDNTETDIIPKYGFIHKPSTVWPIPALPESVGARAPPTDEPPPLPAPTGSDRESLMAQHDPSSIEGNVMGDMNSRKTVPAENTVPSEKPNQVVIVAMDDASKTPIELRSQIQLYATNDQVEHPLVSPLLQGSLGGLCPLYILAGNNEVLRDEIVYLAHRAAHPEQYNIRDGLLDQSWRQRENKAKFTTPTKVHLQVFDGMPHVMTVYSFYRPVKYAYRAIADFVKHVTDHPSHVVQQDPFPAVDGAHSRPDSESEDGTDDDESVVSPGRYDNTSQTASSRLEEKRNTISETPSAPLSKKGSSNGAPDVVQGFIRERVDLKGTTRPLEPASEIPAMQLPLREIGLIKERPANRWLQGQGKWDHRFRRKAEKIVKKRIRNSEKADRIVRNATMRGLLDDLTESGPHQGDDWESRRRWGPLDLRGENPPPSAIAGRRDTSDSIALLKASIRARAGTRASNAPHAPEVTTLERVQSMADDEDPTSVPQFSVSEKQVHPNMMPMHGLNIWAGIMRIFTKKSEKGSPKSKTRRASHKKGKERDHMDVNEKQTAHQQTHTPITS